MHQAEQNEKTFESRVIFSSQRQGQFEKINVSSSQRDALNNYRETNVLWIVPGDRPTLYFPVSEIDHTGTENVPSNSKAATFKLLNRRLDTNRSQIVSRWKLDGNN